MGWHHKELYSEHNDSLNRFIEAFNSSNALKNLIAVKVPTENQKHDAIIIDMDSKQTIGIDWSKSQNTIFTEAKLIYKQYTLIASKYDIETTDLFITTDSNEKYILTVFREDIDKNNLYFFKHKGELRKAYSTNKYKIFSLNDIETFKTYIKQKINSEVYTQ